MNGIIIFTMINYPPIYLVVISLVPQYQQFYGTRNITTDVSLCLSIIYENGLIPYLSTSMVVGTEDKEPLFACMLSLLDS